MTRAAQERDLNERKKVPILIIEDHPVNRELMVSLLEAHGFECLEAEAAAAGIEMARTAQPSLILMDVMLPGMNGLEAARILSQDPRTAHIPVIAVTANAFAKDKAQALAAGCRAFITKPIDTRSFIAEVKRVLSHIESKGNP